MKIWNPVSWLGGIWTNVSSRGGSSKKPVNSEESDAGERVSADAMLQLQAAWRCCALISQTVSGLPLKVYKKTDGRRVSLPSEDINRIIGVQPNSYMSALKFWEMMMLGVLLWGNGYARKLMAGGRLVGLVPMRPECMTIALEGGELKYYYAENGEQKPFSQAEIFHIKGMSVDGIVGLSPISYARQSMGLARAADRAAGSAFKNGMRAGGVLKYDKWLTKEQREDARENVVGQFSGAMNAGGTMILEAGMEYQQVTMNPQDAELLATRKFQQEQIAGWYGVPAWLAGIANSGTSNWGTGLEQQNLGFLTYTLSAYINEIEAAIFNQLLTPAQRAAGCYAEFTLEGLLRMDSAGRAAYYSALGQNGVMDRNEMRAKENLDPRPGGDVLTVQSNLVPLDQLGKVDSTSALKNALQNLLREESPK